MTDHTMLNAGIVLVVINLALILVTLWIWFNGDDHDDHHDDHLYGG